MLFSFLRKTRTDRIADRKLLDGRKPQPMEVGFTSSAKTTRQRLRGHLRPAGRHLPLLSQKLRNSCHLASRPIPRLVNRELPERADPSTTVATSPTTEAPSPSPLLVPNMVPAKKLRQPLPNC
jgi:hypothetical protein